MNRQEIREEINRCFAQGDIPKMMEILNNNIEIAKADNDFSNIPFAYNVSIQEEQVGLPILLSKVKSIDELVERSTRLKFYLRRIDFDAADECMEEIFAFIGENSISVYELISTIYLCTFHKEKMLAWLQDGVQRGRLQMVR